MKDRVRVTDGQEGSRVSLPLDARAGNELVNDVGVFGRSADVELPEEKFCSHEKWNDHRIHAVAMYCSDGRWGEAFDEFCQGSLVIPRYDRFAVPGGPAWLIAGDIGAGKEADSVEAHLAQAAWEQLGLLIRVHDLERIVLMGHYGCAFYRERLGLDPEGCLPVQIEELKLARARVKMRYPELTVEAYMAMRDGERMSFHGNV